MTKVKKNILVTGFSGGAGKSFFIKEGLILEGRGELAMPISHATRKLRGNEQDGVEYISTTAVDFQKKISERFFLEHTNPHKDIYYGSSVSQYEKVRSADQRPVYDVDYEGFEQFSTGRLKEEFIFVLLLTPVWQRIEWMKKRGDMDIGKMLHRVHYSEKIERPFFEKNIKRFHHVIPVYTEKVSYLNHVKKIIELAS